MKLGFVLHSPGAIWAGETLALEMSAGWSGLPAALGNHWVTGRPLNRHAALQPFIAANRRIRFIRSVSPAVFGLTWKLTARPRVRDASQVGAARRGVRSPLE